MSSRLPETFGEADVRIEVMVRLDAAEVRQVAVLVERATEIDGVRPLSEHVSLHLRYGGGDGRNFLLYVDHQLVGYAHLDLDDSADGPVAELVVEPSMRGHGLGRILVTHLRAEVPDGHLRLWSHGEHPAAVALARSLGLHRSRALLQMRRSLGAPLPPAALPPGVEIRTFRPGQDDEAWVELNARAFAHHPEQGAVGLDELRMRMAEPWFDPAGFFLAIRRDPAAPGGERLVGFHWTKVHGRSPGRADQPSAHNAQETDLGASADALADPEAHGHDPIGEVYVVGVDPDEQGQGLGRALTLVGLSYLRSPGLTEVMLYVDSDNTAAIKVYAGLGFAHWDTDVIFQM